MKRGRRWLAVPIPRGLAAWRPATATVVLAGKRIRSAVVAYACNDAREAEAHQPDHSTVGLSIAGRAYALHSARSGGRTGDTGGNLQRWARETKGPLPAPPAPNGTIASAQGARCRAP